ncbi:MAG: IS4 family transposase [bacterium]
MNSGRTIFAQLMEHVSHYEFQQCVQRHGGEHKVQTFSCWDQYLCLAFAQLTYRESLRDIETCLRATGDKLYHLGFGSRPSRNTLANANKVRPWPLWADFAQGLIAQARRLYAHEDFAVELDQSVYALDATVIDLCLSLFPWAAFRRHKGAVKLHTLLDLRGSIPSVVIITPGKTHEVNILDQLVLEAGAIYLLDRGYLDFARLRTIHQAPAFFVTRAKHNTQLRRLYSQRVDKATGVQCDQRVVLKGFYARKHYPDQLRRIAYRDPQTQQRLIFLTNNFSLPALTIARLYKCRWQVELFFKWLKQHLRIKKFYGTTENAVKTQIWIAISVYVLVAILKKRLRLERSLYSILQILSLTLFEKTPILQALGQNSIKEQHDETCKQLVLFD